MFYRWYGIFLLGLFTYGDLDDHPSRQLSYSLTKTLFKISSTIIKFEDACQNSFLDFLSKVRQALDNSIIDRGYH